MEVLRIRHERCGRNLADVTLSAANADWTPDRLLVTPRDKVQQRDHVDRSRAVAGPVGPDGAGSCGFSRTYTWLCPRCEEPGRASKPVSRRHDKLAAEFWKHAASDKRVVWLPV